MRSTQLKTKLAGLLIVAILAVLSLPAFAAAQQTSPSDHQYSNSLSQVSTGGEPPSANIASGGGGGEVGGDVASGGGLGGNVGPLPFTGFDVIAMAAVALAVTGLGLALQRAVSRDADELS